MIALDINSSFTNHIVDIVNRGLPNLPNALFDLLLGILVIRMFIRLLRLAMKITNVQPGLRGVLSSIIETVLWILLTATILGELGFSGIIYFFTGSVAAIGIAMAAGGSTLVSDIIAGIFLARDADFNVGDEVIVGETPTYGVVESLDARRTRVRDERGVLHVIPNSVVERKEWVVIHKRHEAGALVKAAKVARHFRSVAKDKRPGVDEKPKPFHKNNQSNP